MGRRVSGWKVKLALAIGSPLVFLGLIEGGLAIAGVNVVRYAGMGDNGAYWVPWPPEDAADATADAPSGPPGFQRVFPRVYRQFPEQLPLFLRDKPANGWRLFVLGESTVKGLPYEVGCFTDWVRLRATEMLPDRTVEVINAGNAGWHASDIRPLLQECLEYEPDALVWMVGNNEFVPDNVLGLRDELLHPVRHSLRSCVAHLRTARWLRDRLPSLRSPRIETFDRMQSEELPVYGPELPLLQQRFAELTAAAIADARSAGVPIVLCTMPRNLRDWAPSSSYFSDATRADPALRARWDEAYLAGLAALEPGREGGPDPARALAELERAAAIDDAPAKLHYALGRAHEALGEADAARAGYRAALEHEAGPSRAQDWVEAAIREVGARAGVPVVDVQARFDAASPLGVAGKELLWDGLHPNLAGHEIIATMILDALERELRVPFDRRRDVAPSDGRKRLGITEQQAWVGRAGEALNLVKLALQAGVVNETWMQARDGCREVLLHDPGDFEVLGGLGLLEAMAGRAETARPMIARAMEQNGYVKLSYIFFWKTEPPYQKALAAAGLDMEAAEASLNADQRKQLENRLWQAGQAGRR
jgi:tetratricopeptide (TPR) repeat protein